jgi:two-component system cell cycle sensor histidine kinase/response regulator CckA
MPDELKILHLEDDRQDAELVRETLAADGIIAEVECVDTEPGYVCALEQRKFDLILADYSLPSFDGDTALAIASEKAPGIPFIFVSGSLGEEVAIESLKSGATDYVLKHRLQRLSHAVYRAIQERSEREKRKSASNALKASEARYRELFESNPLPMWVYDLETLGFLEVNAAAIKHYGYSYEEFLGMTIKDIRPPEDVSEPNQIVSPASGLERAGTWRHQKRDGTIIFVETTTHPINSTETPSEIVIVNDVTERAQTEEQLRLQGAALEAAANAIMITNHQGVIIWVNPAFTQTTGYAHEEVLGKNTRLLRSGKQDREFYRKMWNTILSGRVWRGSIVNRRKDGTLNHEDMTITPIVNSTGEITHFIAIKQDITKLEHALADIQEKNAQLASTTQQLWQASKLATMGELAASIAHELNNPLATIALRTEALLGQLCEDEEKRRALEIVLKEVDRMATLVNNLLLFSRRSHRQVSTVDLREEVTTSLDFLSYHLRNHKIEAVCDFSNELPTVQADRQQLRQLFLNLITNACDAMSDGGTLTVHISSGHLKLVEAVIVEFEDNGEGIAPGDLEAVWDPFFTTKPEGKGTGLGLAICRRIVEEHGGVINIESSGGSGTTVRLVFPATANGMFEDEAEKVNVTE